MCAVHFGLKDAVKEYELYVKNCAARLDNPRKQVEAMTIKDSSHVDEADNVLYQQFEMFIVNAFFGFAEHGQKP